MSSCGVVALRRKRPPDPRDHCVFAVKAAGEIQPAYRFRGVRYLRSSEVPCGIQSVMKLCRAEEAS